MCGGGKKKDRCVEEKKKVCGGGKKKGSNSAPCLYICASKASQVSTLEDGEEVVEEERVEAGTEGVDVACEAVRQLSSAY